MTLSAAALLVLGVAAAWAETPTPAATPSADVESRVESILGKMTIEEKIDLLGGVDFFYLRGVPRLGVPRLRMADGPFGVRNDGPATTFASGIGLAASWNPALAERVGVEFGRDARAKGVHFLLAPGVNIYRAPIAGRNFEYFGEDPFLTGRIAVGFIKGVQSQGVSATVKHFAVNNTEYDRNHTDSIVDERTLREIYLPAFEAAVKEANVGAIMDAYNLVNGVYMSQNGYLNNEVAKKEWGFQGVMMSDWISTYDGVGAANGGLDVEMPSGEHLNRETLLPAIQAGKVSVATIDDKVRRILRTAVRFGWLDRDAVDLAIPRYNRQGREAALQNARESMVLLKNEGGLLPLGAAGEVDPGRRPDGPPGGPGRRRQLAGAALHVGQLPRGAEQPRRRAGPGVLLPRHPQPVRDGGRDRVPDRRRAAASAACARSTSRTRTLEGDAVPARRPRRASRSDRARGPTSPSRRSPSAGPATTSRRAPARTTSSSARTATWAGSSGCTSTTRS